MELLKEARWSLPFLADFGVMEYWSNGTYRQTPRVVDLELHTGHLTDCHWKDSMAANTVAKSIQHPLLHHSITPPHHCQQNQSYLILVERDYRQSHRVRFSMSE